MKSIETKYVGPSNTRGSRIIATDGDNRLTVQYDDELNSEAAHAKAALALARKMKWGGTLIAGGTKRGYVFVFDGGSTRYSI